MNQQTQRAAALSILLFVVSLTLTNAHAETFRHEGQVVEYGGNQGLDSIEVQVRKRNKTTIETVVTDSDGRYEFSLASSIDSFTLRFKDNRSTTKYNASAQFSVQNEANPNSLDTQGLVSTEQAGNDGEAARKARRGNGDYASSADQDNTYEINEMIEYFRTYYSQVRQYGDEFLSVEPVRNKSWWPQWFIELEKNEFE